MFCAWIAPVYSCYYCLKPSHMFLPSWKGLAQSQENGKAPLRIIAKRSRGSVGLPGSGPARGSVG